MSEQLELVVIVASVREPRIGPVVADWVVAQRPGGVRTRVIDLAEIALPPDAELRPGGSARTEVSDVLAAADGFVIVTPEYNHGVPASLKRFLDWHYTEWMFKPATVVPYGVRGGLLAGEHLRPVLAELSMVTTRRMVALSAPWAYLAEGRYVPQNGEDAALREALRELTWWARALKHARHRQPFALVDWVGAQRADTDPEALADLVGHASVVGLGTGTRSGRETFAIVERTTQALVERGFRVVAVLDNQKVGELYDRFVRGEDVDIDGALRQAWGPWRTEEMRKALERLRLRNAEHPEDAVRVVGVGGSSVLPTDYERVAAMVEEAAPAEAAKIRVLFDVIRTAHDSGEHVQRAKGTHPGTPFVELAREARAIAGQAGIAHELLDAIVDHHANAIGVGYDADREERRAAERVLALRPARVVLWEGSAHVARDAMMGEHLRAELGEAYAAVHVTFGYGQAAGVDVPPPAPGSLEDVLLAAGGERTVALSNGAPAALDAPWRTRLISGVYDPARDGEHYHEVRSLRGAYDAVVFVPEITSTTMVS
ncbi:NAD(P)H-dependent oxidoreductase [Lentzea alba]|uniref:NAD(P)H-dependent oxidoreductase n=1 Tax=Lentzea alba TaxID=2714351 RepID=UPI0039BF7D29